MTSLEVFHSKFPLQVGMGAAEVKSIILKSTPRHTGVQEQVRARASETLASLIVPGDNAGLGLNFISRLEYAAHEVGWNQKAFKNASFVGEYTEAAKLLAKIGSTTETASIKVALQKGTSEARFESQFEAFNSLRGHRVDFAEFRKRLETVLPDSLDPEQKLQKKLGRLVFPLKRDGSRYYSRHSLTSLAKRLRVSYLSELHRSADDTKAVDKKFQAVADAFFQPAQRGNNIAYDSVTQFGSSTELLKKWKKDAKKFPWEPITTSLPYWVMVDKLAAHLVDNGELGEIKYTEFLKSQLGDLIVKGLAKSFDIAADRNYILTPAEMYEGIAREINFWIHVDTSKFRPDTIADHRRLARATLVTLPQVFSEQTLANAQAEQPNSGFTTANLTEKLLHTVASDTALSGFDNSNQAIVAKGLTSNQTAMKTGNAAGICLLPDLNAPRVHIKSGVTIIVDKADLKKGWVQVWLSGGRYYVPVDGLEGGKTVKKAVRRQVEKIETKKAVPKKKTAPKKKK